MIAAGAKVSAKKRQTLLTDEQWELVEPMLPPKATAGQSGPTLGIQSSVFRRHTVDSANWRGVAILAGRVSFALDLLAAAQTVGGRRCLAECVELMDLHWS